MFGGIAWMVGGHMSVGINGNELMVRLGKEAYEDALAQPGAREMDFTGRALKGFVYVSGPGIETDEALASWIERSLSFVESLPPKKKKKK